MNNPPSLSHETLRWQARWITAAAVFSEPKQTPPPCPLFRTKLNLRGTPAQAVCHISGLGFYELSINGQLPDDQVLAPAFTAYDQRVCYLSHPVSDYLTEGENVVGVMLGNGWYNCQTGDAWNFHQAPWRSAPRLICQLDVTYDDGSTELFCSGPQWLTHPGPVTFSDLRQGETFDARLQQKGWNTVDYDDSEWKHVNICPGPGGILTPQTLPPIRCGEAIKPVSMHRTKDGETVFDLGCAIAGWAQLRVAAPSGTEIILRYGEMLKDDGSLDQSNLSDLTESDRFQEDHYILKGEPVEIWSPRFVYHGFRYIHVEGLPGLPSLEHIRGIPVHTDLQTMGHFSCSKPLFNRVQECLIKSTLYNFHGMPTDCPHREKNGWTGDAHLSAEQALMNFDMTAAYEKWLDDLADAQRPSGQLPGIVPTGGWGYNFGSGPAWDSAYPLIVWYVYVYTGNQNVIDRHFDNLTRYVDYLEGIANEGIISSGLGDWCPPENPPWGYECPVEITSTAYFYKSASVIARMAGILGRPAEEDHYRHLAESVRDTCLSQFFNEDTGCAASASQTAQACLIYQGLLDHLPEAKEKTLARLTEAIEARDNHLWTGILGAKYVMHTLMDNGYADLAGKIVSKTTFPGWGYMIREGATTLWETWDGKNGSRLHHMFSDVGCFFYQGLAGIRPDPQKPGFKHIQYRPNVIDGIDWVKADHTCSYGLVRAEWKRTDKGIVFTFSVPSGASAHAYLPGNPEQLPADESGRVNTCTREKNLWVLELPPGTHTIFCGQP